jgi:hypothetical protein
LQAPRAAAALASPVQNVAGPCRSTGSVLHSDRPSRTAAGGARQARGWSGRTPTVPWPSLPGQRMPRVCNAPARRTGHTGHGPPTTPPPKPTAEPLRSCTGAAATRQRRSDHDRAQHRQGPLLFSAGGRARLGAGRRRRAIQGGDVALTRYWRWTGETGTRPDKELKRRAALLNAVA